MHVDIYTTFRDFNVFFEKKTVKNLVVLKEGGQKN
jgi:hypothetical protein